MPTSYTDKFQASAITPTWDQLASIWDNYTQTWDELSFTAYTDKYQSS